MLKIPLRHLFVLGFVFVLCKIFANNVTTSDILLTNQNTVDDYTMLQFNLSWENSWRTTAPPNNWDAVWVFAKYSIDGITWHHARLHNSGHEVPAGGQVQVGLINELNPWNSATNPAVGVFIYRSEEGNGTLNLSGCRLRWDYGTNSVADDALVTIRVFAIEMVYIPQGSFYLGSGGYETSAFYKYPNTTTPFLVSSENAINIGTTADYLYYNSSSYAGDQMGPLPSTFPKGFNGFYIMKYELSQQLYADFLNTISPSAASARFINNNTYRNGITFNGTAGRYETTLPNIPCNFLSWEDGAAFTDWAGLRPFTELEFEKACRGPLQPVANEFAWGTNSYQSEAYNLISIGNANESIGTNYNTSGTSGNGLGSANSANIDAPVRSGIFAANPLNSGRVSSGTSYYGVCELSGNLIEQIISAGRPEGRSFNPIHGDGYLNNSVANVATWPTLFTNYYKGPGARGGAWTHYPDLWISDRRNGGNYGSSGHSTRIYGFRSARSLPASPAE